MSTTYVVAVYDVALAYGGPEEGGWWYDVGTLVKVCRTFRSETAAIAYRDRLDRKMPGFNRRMGRRPKHSVLSSGEFEACIYQDYAPKHFPDQRPHYE